MCIKFFVGSPNSFYTQSSLIVYRLSKSSFKALRIEEAVDQKDGRTPEIRLVLNSCAEIKNNDGTYIIPIQLYFHLLNKLQ